MTYFERQFTDGFSRAAHQEVLRGDEQFMADMVDVLTEKAIADGVHIDFGTNKNRFKQVLDVLNVDLWVAHDKLSVLETTLQHGSGGSTSIKIADVQDAVREHGVVATLEYMQSEAWGVVRHFYTDFVTVKQGPKETSQIILGNYYSPEGKEDEHYISPDTPVVVANTSVWYSPVEYGEYGEETDLIDFIHEHKKGTDPKLFQKLLQESAFEGGELRLPEQTFALSITNKATFEGDMYSSHISPKLTHKYVVVNDRITPYVDPHMSDDEDYIDELL